MDLLVKIDADLALVDTQKRCEVEQAAGFQLDNVNFSSVVQDGKTIPMNKAEFQLKLANRFNKLLFVEVGTATPADLKKSKEGEGWTSIYDSEIYVEGVVTRVMGFGRKS